jgi:hypothetical protein
MGREGGEVNGFLMGMQAPQRSARLLWSPAMRARSLRQGRELGWRGGPAPQRNEVCLELLDSGSTGQRRNKEAGARSRLPSGPQASCWVPEYAQGRWAARIQKENGPRWTAISPGVVFFFFFYLFPFSGFIFPFVPFFLSFFWIQTWI